MIDVEEILRSELPGLFEVDVQGDWDAVVSGSGLRRQRKRRLALAVVALIAVIVVGSAIAAGLGGFSPWLTGEPGKPASPTEQRSFAKANARSWVGFPKGTQLRQLISERVGATKIELLGFRSGTSSLCLRLTVSGHAASTQVDCAPLADLRVTGAPVRVLIVDQPVGAGTHVAWYGLDKIHSAALQITAGVAADNVQSVVVRDQQGRHVVPARSNAFLYVARTPVIFQRVSKIWARTTAGLVSVPFSPSPVGFGFGFGFGHTVSRPSAPNVQIQEKIHGGRVGWLDRREAIGQPLSSLPARVRRDLLGSRLGRIVFGRVITPDPTAPYRIALTLNAHRRGGPPAGLCTLAVGVDGGGGGCAPYPGLFDQSQISFTTSGGGPTEFEQVAGVVSDDVAHLQARLAGGQQQNIPVVDNTFVYGLSRTDLPARLVAYGADGKVIGASSPIEDLLAAGASPGRGRAVELLHVSGPNGEHAELLTGPATGGGECMFVKHYVSRTEAGVMEGCQGRAWTGSPLQLSADLNFLSGRVRSDVARLRLRFATGPTTTLTPTKGYVLSVIPAGRKLVAADGLTRSGHVVGHFSFLPVKR